MELTRALTALENARMEWNAARLKFPVLSSPPQESGVSVQGAAPAASPLLAGHSFGELCRLGLALNWPLAVVGLLALAVLALILLRH